MRHLMSIHRGAALLLAAALPMSAHAQGTRPTVRATVTGRAPLNGACASLMNGPSELVGTPEGLALLRFKRELEGVATIFEQRGAAVEGMDARRVSQVQRGVDSLMRVFVRYRTGDGPIGSTITVQRGDSTMTVNGKVVEPRILIESIEGGLRPGRSDIAFTLRALEPQVAAFASAGARVVANGSPSGYLGVGLSGAQVRMVSDSGSFTAHCDYPMIETVEAGSPARRAGLVAGDTVLAYNGKDVVAQAVNYPQLLVPGKVVRVRVRREGKARELPVTIAERTQAQLEVAALENVRANSLGARQPFSFWPTWTTGDGFVVRSSSPSVAAVAGSSAMMTVLGAQLNAVDDEFAQSMGVEPGVLVMRVQPGSPAAEAGLRAGEMIRAVNGTPVRELPPIQRAISGANVHDVKLTVSGRETPLRIVTIRW
jgi:membrane-associated protease RseP (regulator of RpoE activity)